MVAALRRHFQCWFFIFLWLGATGIQWDVVQGLAWARMFTGYIKSMSLTEAAKKTLQGELCSLCEVVKQAKDSDNPLPGIEASKEKLPIILDLPLAWVRPAQATEPTHKEIDAMGSTERPEPPTPPPRSA